MGKQIKLYSLQDFAEGLAELVLVILILIFTPDYWLLAIAVCFPLVLNIYKFFIAESRTFKWTSAELDKQLSFEEFYNSNGDFQFYDWGFIKIIDKSDFVLEWDKVKTITAYKRDLIVEDQICLQFETFDDIVFTTSEDVEGWFQLITNLNKEFPQVNLETIMNIAHPPFERNITVLFSRDDNSMIS